MTDLPDHNTPEGRLLEAFMHAIWDERHRAHDKHGSTSMEQAPLLAHKRASVLTEEAVECAKALNDHDHGDINLRDGRSNPAAPDLVDPLDKELIQTAAMAYTWWANRRGDQLAPPGPERGYFTSRDPQTEDAAEAIRGVLIERGVYPYLPASLPIVDFLRDLASAALRAGGVPWGTALHDAAAGEEVTVKLSEAGLRAMVEVQIPPIPPIPVRKSSDLSFHEVSFNPPGPPVVEVTAEQARAMGMRPEPPADASWVSFEDARGRRTDLQGDPVTLVREPECVANWPGCYDGGYDPRCCRFPKPCSCEELPDPPADDPDGGRRGD